MPTSSNSSRTAAAAIESSHCESSLCTTPPGNTYAPGAKSAPPGRRMSSSSHGFLPRTSSTVAEGRGVTGGRSRLSAPEGRIGMAMGPSLAALANYDAQSMDLGIGGKVALVTAGTKGIGLGIAHALAAEGARVAVAARTEVDVKRTAQSLGGLGVVADLLTEAGCRRAVSETEQVLGPVDILVNNLGVRAGSSWADTGPAEFESAFVGNLGVSARMTQLVLPGMVERGWGRGLLIASVYGPESGGAPAHNPATPP